MNNILENASKNLADKLSEDNIKLDFSKDFFLKNVTFDFIKKYSEYPQEVPSSTYAEFFKALDDVESLNYLVDTISRIVSNETKVYINDFLPQVVEIEEQITTSTENLIKQNPMANFTIKEVVIPNFLEEGWFREYLSVYEVYTDLSFNGRVTLPELNVEQLKQFIKIEDYATNGYLQEWLSNVSNDKILEVYEKYVRFLNNTVVDGYRDISFGNNFDFKDYLIAGLLATNLIENIPDGTRGNIINYKNNLLEVKKWAFGSLNKTIEKIERSEALRIIILKTDTTNDTIYVSSKLYEEFLKNDNASIELLLGCYVSGNTSRSIDNILSMKDELLKTWNRYARLANIKLRNDLSKNISLAASLAFRNSISELSEFDKILKEDDINKWNENIKNIKNYISSINNVSLNTLPKDIRKISEDIICLKYSDTNFKQFLNAVNIAFENNENEDKDNIFIIATIDLIAKFICNRIDKMKLS